MYQGFYGQQYNPLTLLNRSRFTIYYDAELDYIQALLLAISIYSGVCVGQVIHHCDHVYPVLNPRADYKHASLEQIYASQWVCADVFDFVLLWLYEPLAKTLLEWLLEYLA
jgi:hypothetical protein